MKVKELIAELQKYDGDIEVCVGDSGCNYGINSLELVTYKMHSGETVEYVELR